MKSKMIFVFFAILTIAFSRLAIAEFGVDSDGYVVFINENRNTKNKPNLQKEGKEPVKSYDSAGNLFAIEGTFVPISDEVLDSKPMRALYNPLSKTWLKSVGILGRPASEVWAYLAFEGVGATTSFVTGELGAKLTKDALLKVAENYVSGSPKVICKELAASMMDTGLEAYERNYTRYKAWKKDKVMSQGERVAFTKDNYTSNYLGFGKDLWADVMSYKYKQGKYSSGATKKYLLEEIAGLKGSALTTVEVFDKLKRIVGLARNESLKTYAPYNDHLERIKTFEDKMGVGFSLAKERRGNR